MRHALIHVMVLANASSNDCACSHSGVTASAAIAPAVQPVIDTSTQHTEISAETIVTEISQFLGERALKHVPMLELHSKCWAVRGLRVSQKQVTSSSSMPGYKTRNQRQCSASVAALVMRCKRCRPQ